MANLKVIYRDISRIESTHNLENEHAIIEQLDNYFSTIEGERLFNRSIGSSLRRHLFERCTFTSAQHILTKIRSDMLIFGGKIKLSKGTKITALPDQRLYKIVLQFEVEGLEDVITYNKNLETLDNVN